MANLKQIQPGGKPMASDVSQLVLALQGLADLGLLRLAPPTPAPAAPGLLATGVGNVNGTCKYQLVAMTGWMDSYYNLYVSGYAPGAEATVTATNAQVQVTIPTITAPVIGYAVYRTAASGASGTEKYVGMVTDPNTTLFMDNCTDANRGNFRPFVNGTAIPSSVPTTNTTGTTLVGAMGGAVASLNSWI